MFYFWCFFLTIFCTKIVVDFFGSWPPNHVNKNGVSRCFNQERCDKKTRFNNTWLGANWGSVVQKQEQLGCRHWHRTKKPFRDGSAQVFRAYPTWWSSDISSILQEPFVDHMASVHGNRKKSMQDCIRLSEAQGSQKRCEGIAGPGWASWMDPFFTGLQPQTEFLSVALGFTRPGKRLHNELENHHFQWVNPLFQWAIFNRTFDITRG